MKINKAKLMVATLATATVAATVGSISGTVAWFQYNTRVTAALVGTTAEVSKNLQIRIKDSHVTGYDNAAWGSNLSVATIKAYLDAKKADETPAQRVGNGDTFSPVTFGSIARDAALSTGSAHGPKGNPSVGHFAYDTWANARAGDYIVLPLQVRLINGVPKTSQVLIPDPQDSSNSVQSEVDASNYLEEKVYLSDLTLQRDSTTQEANDMSSALRVHFDTATSKQLWAKATTSVATSAKLDMDGVDGNDKKKSGTGLYDFDENPGSAQEGIYGDRSTTTSDQQEIEIVHPDAKVASYSVAEVRNTADNPMPLLDDDGELDLGEGKTANVIELGTTNADTGILDITATIWFEGWALLNPAQGNADSAVWNDKYEEQKFNVGMSFSVAPRN